MNKIVFASSNAGKLAEVKHFFQQLPFEIIPQSEFNIEPIEETGITFIENAILKARHTAQITNLPTLADDSGFCVKALEHKPGIYSARYGGVDLSFANKIKLLLEEMQTLNNPSQEAYFHCSMALLINPKDPTPMISCANWQGKILPQPRGDKGFGYDPIFYVPTHDCSAGELELEEKNRISHRAQALRQLTEQL